MTDSLAATAHADAPTISVEKVHDARYLINADVQWRHAETDLAGGSPPNPVPLHKNVIAARAVLHRLRVYCIFKQEKLFLLGLGNSADRPSCGSMEDPREVGPCGPRCWKIVCFC